MARYNLLCILALLENSLVKWNILNAQFVMMIVVYTYITFLSFEAMAWYNLDD